MKRYRGYLIDLDGTLYIGSQRIPSAEAFVHRLLELEIPFVFLTNNATLQPSQVAEKIREEYELPITTDHVYASNVAMIDYLQTHHQGDRIHVVGEPSLIEMIQSAGFTIDQTLDAEVVVQALNRQASYESLTQAVLAIRNGAEFLVTNRDTNLPSPQGMVPSSGALTSFIQTATQVEPIVMGKPNAPIIEGALAHLGLSIEECLMIGDNYTTDIMVGINCGMDTCLVTTGFTQRTDLTDVAVQPTYIVDNLLQVELGE